MNPFLKLAQQSNAELQEVVKTSRRSQRRAPDEILREAREKHNFYKNYVANGNHKSGVRQIGMSRIQFGDGDFAQSVQELMRFQESEPRPDPLPEIETPVQLTRTLSRTLRPGESLRNSASSLLFRRGTSGNFDLAAHRSTASVTSIGGGDVPAASDHTLDADDTNGAGLEADGAADGDGSCANGLRSRLSSLGATTFTGAFLRSASSQLPEVGKRRVSIDITTTRQLRANSQKDLSVPATLDGSSACSVQATAQADGDPGGDGDTRRRLSLPNAPHLNPQPPPAPPAAATDNGGSSKGAAFIDEIIRRRPSGVTNPGDPRAVTFALRAHSYTSSGTLGGSPYYSGGVAIKAAAGDDLTLGGTASGLTSPTERRSQYARLEVVLPGSAAAVAAAAGSVPRIPTISGSSCAAGCSSPVARQLQPPHTERTDRLLRVLLQEQPRRTSNGSFLSPSSRSSSNVSLDGDALRQRYGIGRMRHPSWRLGDGASARLQESGEASDWAGSDGGRGADGAPPGASGRGLQDSAAQAAVYCSTPPLAAAPVAHIVGMRRLTVSYEPSGSPESAPSSPFLSGGAEVLIPFPPPNDIEPNTVKSAPVPRAGPLPGANNPGLDSPTVLARARAAAGPPAGPLGEAEQLATSASVPISGAAGGRRPSGTALTGWSSQQRRPEGRDRKPRHTAPSGDSFADVAAMQRLALAQLARAIEAGASPGGVPAGKRLAGDEDDGSGSDSEGGRADAADLALALLSKSAAGIAGRDGSGLNVKGLPQPGVVAVKAKEKGWKR